MYEYKNINFSNINYIIKYIQSKRKLNNISSYNIINIALTSISIFISLVILIISINAYLLIDYLNIIKISVYGILIITLSFFLYYIYLRAKNDYKSFKYSSIISALEAIIEE